MGTFIFKAYVAIDANTLHDAEDDLQRLLGSSLADWDFLKEED